jgi:hypothetical protein
MEMLFAKTFPSLGVEILLFSIEEGLYMCTNKVVVVLGEFTNFILLFASSKLFARFKGNALYISKCSHM